MQLQRKFDHHWGAAFHIARLGLTSILLCAVFALPLLAQTPATWSPLNGAGTDIGVNAQGNAWVIGMGQTIWHMVNGKWIQVLGGATRIAVDPAGNAWVVNAGGQIYHYNGTSAWTLIPGSAMDVGVGANGAVWIIGSDQSIQHYVPTTNSFQKIDGAAVRIAVDPNGDPWVVNSNGNIYHHTSAGGWKLFNGTAKDIAVDASGVVYIIGTTPATGGYVTYRSQGLSWVADGTAGESITAGPSGVAYITRNSAVGNTIAMRNASSTTAGLSPLGNTTQLTTTASTLTLQNPTIITSAPGGLSVSTSGTVGGSLTGGSGLVVGTTGSSQPLVVSGLAPKYAPSGQVVTGKLLCPIIGAGEKMMMPCNGPFTPATLMQKTNSAATYLGKQGALKDAACPPGYRNDGDYCAKPDSYPRGAGYASGCPSGFFDPIDGGSCWKCPDDTDGRGAWIRGADSVKSSTACWRAPKEKLAHAMVVKHTPWAWDCVGDQFWDTQDENGNVNGTCWRCPSDTPRRTGNRVQNADACASAIGNQTASATSLGPAKSAVDVCKASNSGECEMNGALAYPTCKNGYHAFGANVCSPDCPPDMEDIGVSCHKVNCSQYGRVAGLGPAFGDPRNGGECWACPVLMHRSMSPVTNTDLTFAACTAGTEDGIMWQSPQYPEPGLAAFINADIVKLAFNDVGYVDAFLNKRAGGNAAKKQQLWDQMINAPNDSPELKALIFAAMLTVAQRDPTLTSRPAGTVSQFQGYIQARRTFLANEANAMYNSYLDFNSYKIWQGTKATMLAGGPLGFISAGTGAVITSPGASLSSTVGVPPDDYVNAAYAAAVPDSRGQDFLKAAADLGQTSYTNPSLGTASFDPTSSIQLGLSTMGSAKAIYDVLTQCKVVSAISALEGKASMGLDMGMSLGGSVLDAVAAIMTVFAQEEAKKQYGQLVEKAQEPVNVANIMKSGSDDDKNSLLMWWALATSPYKSSDTAGQNQLKNAEVCATYGNQCSTIVNIIKSVRPAATVATVH